MRQMVDVKSQTVLTLTVNGEAKQMPPGSVLDLLAAFGIMPTKVAVERNREIVPKSAYGTTLMADGDQFEIVQFVGGG